LSNIKESKIDAKFWQGISIHLKQFQFVNKGAPESVRGITALSVWSVLLGRGRNKGFSQDFYETARSAIREKILQL
jgi:hypothetical protein